MRSKKRSVRKIQTGKLFPVKKSLAPGKIEWSSIRCAAPQPSGSTWSIFRNPVFSMPAIHWRCEATGGLYDPELIHEVAQAVERANIKVDTVFAMHQGPTPWSQV